MLAFFCGMFNHISVYLWQQVCTQALRLRTRLRERNWVSEMNTSSKARLRQKKKVCESLGGCDDESAYYHVRVSGIKVSDQWQTSSAVQMPREITTQTWNMEAHDCTFGTHTEIERKSQLGPGFCTLRFFKPDELNDTQWSSWGSGRLPLKNGIWKTVQRIFFFFFFFFFFFLQIPPLEFQSLTAPAVLSRKRVCVCCCTCFFVAALCKNVPRSPEQYCKALLLI